MSPATSRSWPRPTRHPSASSSPRSTVGGQVYEVGDTRLAFTILSVSKPLVYGAALEDCGRARVPQTVGVEPTGHAFNSISLDPGTGRPLKTMINAGAIAFASLIHGETRETRLARVVGALSAYAGRPLSIDEAVFESERSTGHRNRAIGYMLRTYGIVEDDPEPALELYFKQCSVLVDCRDLAMMAATLANGGVNPATGQRAVRAEFISSILSVMTTCGIYDFSGEWVYRVGMPAKSGVGGGVLAVLSGQPGIGVFSPLLDERGNSVRGVKVCDAISSELGLHFLQTPRAAAATAHARYTLADVRSKRRRPPAENALLDSYGARATVYELQGDLRFSTIEPVLREVFDAGEALHFVMLDFKSVAPADAAAKRMLARMPARMLAQMLARMIECCAARGQQVVPTRVKRGELLADLGAEIDPRCARDFTFQPQLDLGLEWCERGLLARHAPSRVITAIVALAEHRLCAEASVADIEHLAGCVEHSRFDAGSTILKRGEPAEELFLLMRGEISVVVKLQAGGSRRLATLSAGMAFGETALIAGGKRSADVNADTDVEWLKLSASAFAELEAERPSLMIRLLRNLQHNSADTTTRLTAEVAALEG